MKMNINYIQYDPMLNIPIVLALSDAVILTLEVGLYYNRLLWVPGGGGAADDYIGNIVGPIVLYRIKCMIVLKLMIRIGNLHTH